MKFFYLIIISLFLSASSLAQTDSLSVLDILDLSLSDLMDLEVSVASKTVEKINDAPGIITVISKQEIESFAASNLGDILNRIPGAITLSANIFVENIVGFRGQTLTPYNNHTLILINGRPLRDPISGGLNSPFFTSFPVSIIERIEVIRGPGSVLFGSCAYSGVINVITSQSNENDLYVNLEAGNRNSFKEELSFNLSKNDFKLNAGINHYQTDGPFFEFTDYLNVDSSANFNRKNLGAFANIQYKGFSINTSYLDFYGFGLAGEDNNWDFENAQDNNRQKVSWIDLGYSTDLGESINISANYAYNKHSWDHSPTINMTAFSSNFELTAKYRPTQNIHIVSGISLDNNTHKGERFIDDVELTTSVYTQAKFTIANKVHLIGGFQFNKPEYISGHLSPRVGLIGNITDNFGVKALYSEAFRNGYPLETSFDLFVFRGNKELKPELIKTTEFQLFFNTDKISTTLTTYYSKMQDVIIRLWHNDPLVLPLGGYLQYHNGGEIEFMGLEYEWKASLNKRFSTVGSVTYQLNKDDNGIENVTLHPNFMAKLGLMYNSEKLNVGIYNSYFGEPSQVSTINPGVNNVNEKAEAFNLLSAKMSLNLSELFSINSIEELRFSVSSENMLASTVRYPEFTTKGINTLLPLYNGRIITFGLSVRL